MTTTCDNLHCKRDVRWAEEDCELSVPYHLRKKLKALPSDSVPYNLRKNLKTLTSDLPPSNLALKIMKVSTNIN